MNADYIAALRGSLASTRSDQLVGPTTVRNATNIFLRIYGVGENASLYGFRDEGSGGWVIRNGYPGLLVNPYLAVTTMANRPPLTISTQYQGRYLLVTSAHTGGFLGVVKYTGEFPLGTIVLDENLLVAPNDIGPVPEPNADTVVPKDTPRVVVGIGSLNGNRVVREQFWRRIPQSYSLAPGETRTVTHTTTSGMQTTTSQLDTVAASVGVSASAGWGPVSASVSASLSRSTTTFQQVTVSSEESVHHSDTVTNNTTIPQMYVLWQLMDVVTVLKDSYEPDVVSSIVSGLLPTIVRGPYNSDALPPAVLPLEPSVPAGG
jgi:hypothetical protein